MHLIPESWSHLHMLVSVFPSVGLVFVLGFYVTALVTKNEGLARTCLMAFAVLAILAIPTYFSGTGSATALAQDPKISPDKISMHLGWGWAALGTLVLTGIAAAYALMRSNNSGRLSNDLLHLVLGLGLITVGFMIVVGEMGWEISHHELQLVAKPSPGVSASDIPEGIGTPQGWSHIHMILNHFPTVGFVVSLAFFIISLATKNVVMQRGGLVAFTICGVLGAPTYVTGAAAMWALVDNPDLPGISQAAINAHRDFAIWSLFGLAATGVASWIGLWRYRHIGKLSSQTLNTVLVFAIITLGIMAETGHRGGQINHPEIRTEPLPTDPDAFLSPHIESLINNVIWFVPWQTVHFFGYSLVFGTVLAVVLRVLGFWKSVPFSAVHRFLPLGVFGVVMNIFTGMLMLMADTYRYVNETSFYPKMFFLPIGAIAVIYFSLSNKLWTVKAGEDAPMTAKWVAALVLLSWIAVIMGGRLLPYV